MAGRAAGEGCARKAPRVLSAAFPSLFLLVPVVLEAAVTFYLQLQPVCLFFWFARGEDVGFFLHN